MEAALDVGVVRCQVSERDNTLGPQLNVLLTVEGDMTVSTQGDREQICRTDRRLVVADGCAFVADGHLSAFDEGEIGGGAADIEHQGVVEP